MKPSDDFCSSSYEAICKESAHADPTGETSLDYRGEIRALRVLRKIVRTNPGWTTDQVEDELVKRIYTPERKAKLQRIFEYVRGQMTSYLEGQNSNVLRDADKAFLIDRIRRVQLELPVDRTTYADVTDLYTKSEIYYERSSSGDEHRVRVGGAYVLNTSSEYSIIFTMAHELAHAIDPCGIPRNSVNHAVYDELVQCFVDSHWISKDEAQCGNKDKSSEVFADWLGTEILARAIRQQTSYSLQDKTRAAINAVRDLCDDSSGFEKVNLEYYPTDVVRVGGIFANNALLRKELQCSASSKAKPYCRFDSLPSKGSN
ncbi:hypothetical protein [Bdellovibrio sp. HCB288]|uniref:hypothetical protein n=1 Tax=Bdellovibrio sp. HCB288 TaxID=3394355 RepID=UPI0039B40D8B